MPSGDTRPPARGVPCSGTTGTYSVHPLPSLDGVLLYVTLNGEAVGSWFGATEELAVRAFARHLTGAASDTPAGTRT